MFQLRIFFCRLQSSISSAAALEVEPESDIKVEAEELKAVALENMFPCLIHPTAIALPDASTQIGEKKLLSRL